MNQDQQQKPLSFKILCSLSAVNILTGLYSAVLTLSNGKRSAFDLKEAQAERFNTVDDLQAQGMSDLAELTLKVGELEDYLNEFTFGLTIYQMLVLALGLVGVYFMFQLRKLGFQLYILYSILGIATSYFFAPASMVPLPITAVLVILSGLFIFFYSRFLKYMK